MDIIRNIYDPLVEQTREFSTEILYDDDARIVAVNIPTGSSNEATFLLDLERFCPALRMRARYPHVFDYDWIMYRVEFDPCESSFSGAFEVVELDKDALIKQLEDDRTTSNFPWEGRYVDAWKCKRGKPLFRVNEVRFRGNGYHTQIQDICTFIDKKYKAKDFSDVL